MANLQFRDVVKKYASTDQALGVPGGEVGGIPVPSAEDFATAEQGAKADTAVQPDDLGAAATMSPVEVVTDPDAQAALSGAFVSSEDGETFSWNGQPVNIGGGNVDVLIETVDGYPARSAAPMVIWRGWTDPTEFSEFVTGVDLWAEADPPTTAWFTDFSADATNESPAGWTSRWAAFTSATVVEEAGEKFLRLNKTSGVSYAFLSWDVIPAAADVEVVAKWRTNVPMVEPGVVRVYRPVAARAAGESHEASVAYMASYDSMADALAPHLGGYRRSDASIHVPTPQPVLTDWADQSWNWVRLRVNGTTVSTKGWPDGEPEPEIWQTAANDGSPITAAGLVGVVHYVTGTTDIACVGVAIGGGTAPISAP